MQQPAGTLPSDGDDVDGSAGRSGPGTSRARGATRFVYASGSRPLGGYTIKRGIGVGGFGEVYYATSDAGKEVALKHIQRNLDVELRGVKQCLNLKHPNLVALYDIRYDQDGRAWVVMEYAAGESLQEVIDRNPNGMPVDQVGMWVRGIAAGLGYLHDHGIVHRDLKPGNLFLDEGVVKIGDYGLSKFISCSRRSGQTESVGTFHYMAPEIGQGRYGKEIDLYALGIILYEMLTGNVPFDGESSQEIIMKHLTAQPSLERVPLRFRAVIANALAKDPRQRTGSVRELMSQLPAISGPAAVDADQGAPVIDAEVVSAGRGNVHPTEVPVADAARTGTRPSDAAPLADEPIAHAVHDSWIRLRRGWDSAHLGTVPRFVILLAVVLALLTSISWLMPLGMLAGLIYLVYLLIRALVTGTASQPARAAETPAGPVAGRPLAKTVARNAAGARRRSWRDVARERLRAKPARVRLTELIGSLLMAAVVCAVLCLVMLIFASQGIETSLLRWAPLYTWMTLTSILGAWGILACGKLWEGSHDEPSRRRFTMLAVGLIVGAASLGLAHGLDIQPTYLLEAPRSYHEYPTGLYENNGTPNALGYLGYFAGLLVALRWWKQADPLRPVRLSIFATFVCVFWAIILFAFLPFPRGFLVAATMSIAVQLSGPWLSREQRKQYHEIAPEV